MPDDLSIVALDVGSTRFKAGALAEDGSLRPVVAVDAPPVRGSDLVREADPLAYLEAAASALDGLPRGGGEQGRLGLTSQRSSFLLWRKEDGQPVTPLLSWQDRRAADWCATHAAFEKDVQHRTGLRLSPHYLGPKAAVLLQDADLAAQVGRGDLLLGTLDTYFGWCWSGGRVFMTDVTMAARTLLFDLDAGDWHPELLALFGISRDLLPEIGPSLGRSASLDTGWNWVASIADQASGLVASLGVDGDGLLINLGTGGFVLMPTGDEPQHLPGYLCGPYLADGNKTRYALEGTINGAGSAIDQFGSNPVDLVADRYPDAFCLPDVSGWGAPFWLPDRGLTLSESAQKLSLHDQRRVVLEGLLFRVRQIVDDLIHVKQPTRTVVSGGVTKSPFVRAGLVGLLPGEVRLLEDTEATLRGAALLAGNRFDRLPPMSEPLKPDPVLADLPAKYQRWKTWVADVVGRF